MATATLSIDRETPRLRPAGKPIGYHHWSDLLFVHWRVPAAMIEPLVPKDLTIDTFDGDAWVGLVPFHMSGVRPCWSPALPGLSVFHETNVRTYVHHRGAGPGVWFLSLEAARLIAVMVARRGWNLNYHWAAMQIERRGDRLRYLSRRLWPARSPAHSCIEAEIGEALDCDDGDLFGGAAPGTLEHFLVERYFLYSQSRQGRLLRAQVHHRPYELRDASLRHLDESLLASLGICPPAPPCHAVYSPAVSVEIFPLVPV